ncbi:MAG: ABC transporter ATP-binding protein [Gammaproteobacteria bacterium]
MLLSVEDLSKRFRTRHGVVHAVAGVSFEIATGETVALVGESGCGKSTVALSLLKLIDRDGGRVVFDGRDLDEVSGKDEQRLRQELSIVFQNPYSSLNPRMRIHDIVAEPIKTAYRLRGGELTRRVMAHLSDVGLGSEHIRRYPHEFSGGQRQRIAIARALALEPKLLILDEPTAALDVSVQAQVLNLLRDLQGRYRLSYLLISHNLATVESVADRVLVMYFGRIVESGTVRDVFNAPRHPYTRALLDSVPTLDPGRRTLLEPLHGELPSPFNPPSGCAFAPRCRHVGDACLSRAPALGSLDAKREVACFHPIGARCEG